MFRAFRTWRGNSPPSAKPIDAPQQFQSGISFSSMSSLLHIDATETM
jgi:hypothetical protein